MFDLVVLEALCWTFFQRSSVYVYIIVVVVVVLIEGFILYNINKVINNFFTIWVIIQAIGIIITMIIFFFNGPKF